MIRAIDNQLAVQRANDMTRDASAHLRQAELTHDFQARINRAMEAKEQQQVLNKSEAKEEAKIKPERDGSNDPSQGKQKKKEQRPKSEYDDLLSGAIAPAPYEHRVDIEV